MRVTLKSAHPFPNNIFSRLKYYFRFSFDDQAARRRLWNEFTGRREAGRAGRANSSGSGVRDVGNISEADAIQSSSSSSSTPATSHFATVVNLHFIAKSRDALGVSLTFETADASPVAVDGFPPLPLSSCSPSSSSSLSPLSFEVGDFVTLSTMQVWTYLLPLLTCDLCHRASMALLLHMLLVSLLAASAYRAVATPMLMLRLRLMYWIRLPGSAMWRGYTMQLFGGSIESKKDQ
jgi:hypothetical protein